MSNNEAAEVIQEQPKYEDASTLEEVLETRSVEEIEKEILAEQTALAMSAANRIAPEDLATYYFQMMFPIFRDKVHGLNAKNCKELLIALAQFPVMTPTPKFTQKAAGDAFQVGVDLFNAKFILRTKAEMDLAQREFDSTNLAEGEPSLEAQEILSNVETTFEQGTEKQGE